MKILIRISTAKWVWEKNSQKWEHWWISLPVC